ncbi:unnamed protein product, partial [Prorocentrum cordatum]
ALRASPGEARRARARRHGSVARMITFLPLPDFAAVARLLDDRRLGSQRVEARFILRCVRNAGGRYARFQNTGYVRMWVGHEDALAVYYNTVSEEWLRRGFREGVSKAEDQGPVRGDIHKPGHRRT